MAFLITKPLVKHKQEYTVEVNTLAGEKILALYPQYKQANMTARYVELMKLNELTSTEALAIEAAWDWIKAIRAQSNVANSTIDSSVDMVGIRLALEDFKVFLSTT